MFDLSVSSIGFLYSNEFILWRLHPLNNLDSASRVMLLIPRA